MSVLLNPSALAHLQTLQTKLGHGVGLRITVKSGGCSGLRYIFSVEEFPDVPFHAPISATDVLVDPLSLAFIEGSQVEYQQDMMGARFVLFNPKSTASCGCGASFMLTT